MVKVTVEKDGEKEVHTGKFAMGVTIVTSETISGKKLLNGERFAAGDVDDDDLPEIFVNWIDSFLKEIHETPVDYLYTLIRTLELLHETTESAITENADSLVDTLRAVLKGEVE